MHDARAFVAQPQRVLSGESIYILLWALTPLVSAAASRYTAYPNQIYAIYEIMGVGLCALLFRNFLQIVRAQAKWQALLALYCLTFIIVSYYGVDFATSVRYGVLYLPLILLEFFISFSIGYMYREQRAFRYVMGMALVLTASVLLDMYLSPSQERFVTTLNIPMAIPPFVFSGHALLAVVCVIVLLMSLKKTVAVIGILSFGMAFLLKPYVLPGMRYIKRFYTRKWLVFNLVTVAILLTAAVVILVGYSANLSATIARFGESEDTSRSAIALYSALLLAQYFPKGIGLYGFLYLSADVMPYQVIDARGEVLTGANLHSSYMTWALEGGAPVLLIVLILFWALLRVIWAFLRGAETKVLGATLLIWLLGGLIFGAFQQWHNSGTFWEMFGFAFGCHARYRSER